MVIFRNKKTNKLYSVNYVQNEIDKTLIEYKGDRSLLREFLEDRFTIIDLFESPLTEKQQQEIKDKFELWCTQLAQEEIISKYEVTELIEEG